MCWWRFEMWVCTTRTSTLGEPSRSVSFKQRTRLSCLKEYPGSRRAEAASGVVPLRHLDND